MMPPPPHRFTPPPRPPNAPPLPPRQQYSTPRRQYVAGCLADAHPFNYMIDLDKEWR